MHAGSGRRAPHIWAAQTCAPQFPASVLLRCMQDIDLKRIGLPSLPADVNSAVSATVPGPVVLQVGRQLTARSALVAQFV
jgi:hypothetical protein